MKRNLAIAALTLLFSGGLSLPSWAETVMEKVMRTGVLTAGTRTHTAPFAYMNEQEQLVGYSIDMLDRIRQEMEAQLGKEITLELVEVTPDTRIPAITSRTVDLVCGVTSFTWDRDVFVDFSLSYAVTGTRLLVKDGNTLGSPESLKGKKVGVLLGTTNEQVIQLIQPDADLVPMRGSAEGLAALQEGRIDAFAWDGILLEGLRKTAANPDELSVVPEVPYTREGIACMMPEDNSKFRDLVNYSLAKFMQGYLMERPDEVALINRWFGAEGVTPINQDLVVEFFRDIIDTHSQVPIAP